MAGGPVLDLHEGEYRARLHRKGKKMYRLRVQKVDMTWHLWKTLDIELPFGVVKARAAALAYWEMWKIKEGGE